MKTSFASLAFILLMAACAPKIHEGKYTHEEYWENEIHREHDMDYVRHDAGHGLDCGANGMLLDHCDDDSQIHQDHPH